MWLIGLDQKRGIVGAKHQELSSWLPQVQRCFDGVSPAFQDLNIATPQGRDIVALQIDTERAPFVVTTPTSPEREVPWREGTRTRSANRSELLLMLSQAVLVPDVEVLDLTLWAYTGDGKSAEETQSTELQWNVRATLYITPLDDHRITIPKHRCIAIAEIGNMRLQLNQASFGGEAQPSFGGIRAQHEDNPNLVVTSSQLILDGPAKVTIFLTGIGPMKSLTELPEITHVTVDFGVAGAIRPASVSGELNRREPFEYEFAQWSNRTE